MAGTKETKELLIGINELSIYLLSLLKDGASFKDAMDFYNYCKENEEFKLKLFAAYDGCKQIPEEVKDLDLLEVFEIAQLQLNFVPAIIKAVKK